MNNETEKKWPDPLEFSLDLVCDCTRGTFLSLCSLDLRLEEGECDLKAIFSVADYYAYSSQIKIDQSHEFLHLILHRDFIVKMALELFGLQHDSVNEDNQDIGLEILNMIAGSLKTEVLNRSPKNFEFGIPFVHSQPEQLFNQKESFLNLSFQSDFGPFHLLISKSLIGGA